MPRGTHRSRRWSLATPTAAAAHVAVTITPRQPATRDTVDMRSLPIACSMAHSDTTHAPDKHIEHPTRGTDIPEPQLNKRRLNEWALP